MILKNIFKRKAAKGREYIELDTLLLGEVKAKEVKEKAKESQSQQDVKIDFNLPSQARKIGFPRLIRPIWNSISIIFDIFLFAAIIYAIYHVSIILGFENALLNKIGGIIEQIFSFIIVKGGF